MKDLIYLDHQATTPVDPRVFDAMKPYFCEVFGNPSSRTHRAGWMALEAVQKARSEVASLIGARRPQEVVFTSGATESNNLALRGVLHFDSEVSSKAPHFIVSAGEHKAILDPATRLEELGCSLTVLPVDAFGRVSFESVRSAIREETKLISLMMANNEIGSINPIAEIGALAKEASVLFHVDAAQAVGKIDVDVNELHIDLLSISSHKMYGPKGVGALWVRSRHPTIRLEPLIVGGGQEFGFRSGTLNVPGIVGFGAACVISMNESHEDALRIHALTHRLHEVFKDRLKSIDVNGPPISKDDRKDRLPGNLSIRFEGVEGEEIMQGVPGIAVSAGSACTSSTSSASHVLKAIGLSDAQAFSTLRFGLGRFTNESEVDRAGDLISSRVLQLRRSQT